MQDVSSPAPQLPVVCPGATIPSFPAGACHRRATAQPQRACERGGVGAPTPRRPCDRRSAEGQIRPDRDGKIDEMRSDVSPPRMRLRGAAPAAAVVMLALFAGGSVACAQSPPANAPVWTVPEIGALPDNANTRVIRRGRDLVTATYARIGPEVPDRADRFAGNNLACGNCHLQAGTKKFGIPLFGLFGKYPRYTARSEAEVTIEGRLNACMTPTMNRRALPTHSPPIQP